MNVTVVGLATYYQCGEWYNVINNFTSEYGLGSAYICGYQQALYTSGGRRLTSVSLHTWLLVIVMMFGVVFADVGLDVLDVINQQQQNTPSNVTEVAIHSDQQLSDVLGSSEVGTIIFDLVSNTTYQVEASNYTDLDKRDLYCTHSRQTQVANSGIWWSPWYKVGSCVYTGDSDGGAQYLIGYTYTYTWSIQVGPIGWGEILSIIGGQWQKSVSHSSSLTCIINPHLTGSVWYQTQVLWGNAQYRSVSVCNGRKTTGSWLKYYHFNTPSRFDTGSGTVHLGCSTGAASQCP